MNTDLKKLILPNLIAVLVFLIVSMVYFSPRISGKKLDMHDWKVWQASAKEKNDFREQTGEITCWTNSMFGGMPTYLISTPKEHNVFAKIQKIMGFGFGEPITFLFYYLLGFYILLRVFRLDVWWAIAGALAFGFSSYFFIIIAAGHLTKAAAIGFIAPIIAGVYLAYDRKVWHGMLLMTFFLALQILTNHLQIVYYTGLVIIGLGIAFLIDAILQKTIVAFLKNTGILFAGVALAIGINATNIITTQEYAPYSLRGQTELTNAQHIRTTGLDKDYATAWSYGIDETFTLLIPNVKGGASGAPLSEDTETYNVLKRYYGDANASQIITQMPVYFGPQPFTSGPVYIGAIVFFLFVLSLMIVPGRIKWALLALTVLSIMLSWGKNMMWLTDLFLDYFPGYNKFRTVSMTLVIAEFTMPLLAFLAIREIVLEKQSIGKLKNYFYISVGITVLCLLVFIAAPGVAGSEGTGEYQFAKQMASALPDDPQYDAVKKELQYSFVNAIQQDRLSLIRADAARSLAFVLLGALVVFLLINKKLITMYAGIALAVLIVADMWPVNRRYLNDDNFVSKRSFEVPYSPSIADNAILADKHPHYRVCNLSVSLFNDASTSYFHKSVGGYHGAKMRRYQELMDSVMSSDEYVARYYVNAGLQNGLNSEELQLLFDRNVNLPMLNMLNTRYIIYSPNAMPIVNNKVLGNAWFVKSFRFVQDANEEIVALRNLNPGDEAIVDLRYEALLKTFVPNFDSTAQILLTKYAPNRLMYETNVATPQLAVFSEIFYSKGWKAYVDGKETPHFRANYVLRAMIVPEGKHNIEFVFDPPSYRTGNIISYISSAIVLLMIGAVLFFTFRRVRKKE